jgi:hypothetical protein
MTVSLPRLPIKQNLWEVNSEVSPCLHRVRVRGRYGAELSRGVAVRSIGL